MNVDQKGLPTVYSGAPASYEISGVAESDKPFIDVGDVKLFVQVRSAVGARSAAFVVSAIHLLYCSVLLSSTGGFNTRGSDITLKERRQTCKITKCCAPQGALLHEKSAGRKINVGSDA